jgi:hypothetical protein
MSTASTEPGCPAEMGSICARRHWAVYWLLIVVSFSINASNIARLQNFATRGESPFFSANDRSRWCTVYSLVHFGTYEIDGVVSRKSSIHWDTIDKVMHVGQDGKMHQYSSKPPMYPTFLAGQYWVIRAATGWNLDEHPLQVARIMLLINHAIPLALMLVMLASMLERWFVSDWTRYFVLAAAGFGTFLSTFAATLNNHLPAAVATMAAIFFADRIFQLTNRKSWWNFFGAGIFSGLAMTFELPAAALVGGMGLALFGWHVPKTIFGYGVGVVVSLVPFLICNYLAHGGIFELAYKHRTDGPVIERVNGDFTDSLDSGILPTELKKVCQKWIDDQGAAALDAPRVEIGTWMGQSKELQGRWVVRDAITSTQFALLQTVDGEFEVREWFNWYDFPGSYWSSNKRSPIDRGEADVWMYAFHMTLGHHGLFLLTPLWGLSFAGMLALLIDRRFQRRWLGGLAIALSVIVFAFYLRQEPHDRNYGGQTSGLRWMFWLIPFWLLTMVPTVQWLAANRKGRTICLVLLAASILSAGYSIANPWVHPWALSVFEWMGETGIWPIGL